MSALNASPGESLKQLLQRFVSGEDQSRDLVNRIEALLVDQFEGTAIYEDLIFPVASFNPMGGEFTYDRDRLAAEFRHALRSHLGEDRE